MNYTLKPEIGHSRFVMEDYFPLIIEFSDKEINNDFCELNYKDTDMIEFDVDKDTRLLKRLTLTLCHHYVFEEEKVEIPQFIEGTIYINELFLIECNKFQTKVFTDGIVIETSENYASRHIKYGNVIFALSDSEEIVAITIIDLKEDEIEHVKNELTI